MRILVKFASRSRPGRFFEGLDSIYSLVARPELLTVFCCLDRNDATIFDEGGDEFAHDFRARTAEFCFRHTPTAMNIIYDPGNSVSKIDAINRKVPDTIPWDILVNFSDDMRFTVYGWDELIREGFRCNGPDKFLHYPDSTAKNMLATMSIMDRAYFERDGYIYHPSYKSLWCDNEAMEVAKLRGCYVYMGIQIFDHLHPAYGLAQWDEQYRRQQTFWEEDELNFKIRQAHNFYLDGVDHK